MLKALEKNVFLSANGLVYLVAHFEKGYFGRRFGESQIKNYY